MLPPTPWFPVGVTGGVVALLAALSVLAWARRWSPSLRTALLVALVVRAAGVALAYGHTPHDVATFFRHAGELVQQGRDPLTQLPRFQWNFLPLMPVAFAAALETGLPWEIGGKLLPVAADLWTVVVLGRLALPGHAARARLLYALSPLALLVTSWHGQVEPVSVALGLTALLLARSGRAASSGGLLGLAVASKTWPVLFTIGVLRTLRPRQWPAALLVSGAVVALFLVSTVVLLGDTLGAAVHVLAGYRSFSGQWGWTGLLNATHHPVAGYTGGDTDHWQRVGSVLVAASALVVLAVWRRLPGPDLYVAVVLVFFATAPGFGTQYLLWPCALLYARPRRGTAAFLALSAAYATYVYLVYLPAAARQQLTGMHGPGVLGIRVLQYGSLPVIAAGLVALLLLPRRPEEEREPVEAAPAGELSPA
ncbi:MAG: glycosyltransferase 87 family protein [Mycobacteriales bacterium]